MGWVIAACGAFAVGGAILDWEWFMQHRKAQFFVRLFGRNGARIFYGVLGAGLLVLGLLFVTGFIRDAK